MIWLRWKIAQALDWFDDRVFEHRWYWFCTFVLLAVAYATTNT